MVRVILCAAAALMLTFGAALADDKADKTGKADKKVHSDKNAKTAKIVKVDPKKGTITLKMKNKEGKEVERTFNLTEDVVYADSTGRVARVDVFTNGDDVLVIEREGKLVQVKKKGDKTGKDKRGDRKPEKR